MPWQIDQDWWRSAVVYQVYPRSFADSDGDGVGDIAGLQARLPYLVDLGVDAVWISPWYPSPMKDAGYDVSDYRDIDPLFGTLAQARGAGRRGAPSSACGCSSTSSPTTRPTSTRGSRRRSPAPAGSPERGRFLFRDGRGAGGDQPPNDWQSQFGGPAWSRVTDRDGAPGQWYLHLFAPEQPDLDWTKPEVRADFEHTLRFWFDLGIDGFRIDVAHGLVKAELLPDVGELVWPKPATGPADPREHPYWDQPRRPRHLPRPGGRIADSYPDRRVFVAEAWVQPASRLARYVRPDELNTAFNFEYLVTPWRADVLRTTIDRTIDGARPPSARRRPGCSRTTTSRGWCPATPARRPTGSSGSGWVTCWRCPPTSTLGVRRARAAALLLLALPGGAYIYQGEELGLPEVENLPVEVLQDPRSWQSGPGFSRDGCRVPLPWSGEAPPYGFSPPAPPRRGCPSR